MALAGPLCIAFFLGVQAAAPAPCTGQPQDAPPLPLLAPSSIGADAVRIVTAPARWDDGQHLRLLGFAGVTAAVMATLDEPLQRHVSGHGVRGSSPHAPTHALSALGRTYDRIGPARVLYGTAGALAATGLLTRRALHTRTAIRVVEAVFFTNLLTGALKGTIGRARPYTGMSAHATRPFDLQFESEHRFLSMPSGHTSGIFAAASVIAHQYDHWWVQVPVYATATSAGIQRVSSGNHWLSDVVVGAALGYWVGRLLTADEPTAPPHGGIAFDPVLSTRSVGLSLRF